MKVFNRTAIILIFIFSQILSGQIIINKADPVINIIKHSCDYYLNRVPMNSDSTIPLLYSESQLNDLNIIEYNNPLLEVVVFLNDSNKSNLWNATYLKIQSNLGKIITARIRLNDIENLAEEQNVDFICHGNKLKPQLDIADGKVKGTIARNRWDKKGRNVIVGLIDTGIDITHEDFKKSDGNTRILKIWDQKDINTPHPIGWSYGREWSYAQINGGNASCDERDLDGHGTSVAGVMCGNGRATGNNQPPNTYVGVAPESDIVAVKLDWSNFAYVIDGIMWIDKVAVEKNKPWVVNLSLGYEWGPRDGSSPFEQAIFGAIQNSSGKGRIISVSAGNDGYESGNANSFQNNKLHTSSFSSNSTKQLIVNSTSDYNSDRVDIEIFYPKSKNGTYTDYNITLISPLGRTYGPYSTGQGNATWLSGLKVEDGIIAIHNANYTTTQNPYPTTLNTNLIWIVLTENLVYHNKSLTSGHWQIKMEAKNNSPIIKWDAYLAFRAEREMLRINNYIYFHNDDFDNTQILNEPANAFNIITVGSFTSKNEWWNKNNQHITFPSNSYPTDVISHFSSPGPTRDGRNKPEIYAPGCWVASSMSDDRTYTNEQIFISKDDKHINGFGTSLSSPFVAGTVALLLEKNPDYTYSQILTFLNNGKTSKGFLDIDNTFQKLPQNPATPFSISQLINNSFWFRQNYISVSLSKFIFAEELSACFRNCIPADKTKKINEVK